MKRKPFGYLIVGTAAGSVAGEAVKTEVGVRSGAEVAVSVGMDVSVGAGVKVRVKVGSVVWVSVGCAVKVVVAVTVWVAEAGINVSVAGTSVGVERGALVGVTVSRICRGRIPL